MFEANFFCVHQLSVKINIFNLVQIQILTFSIDGMNCFQKYLKSKKIFHKKSSIFYDL